MSGRISGMPTSVGGSILDAPNNGVMHGRKDEAWEPITLQVTVGDVKNSFLVADHNGWIKLDGRLVSTLTVTQQQQAGILGFTTNIPNATGVIAYQNGGTPGAISGAMSRALTVANLPNHTMTAASAGAHTHVTDNALGFSDEVGNGPRTGRIAAGGTGQHYIQAEASTVRNYDHTHTAQSNGAHTHTVPLGGSATPFDFTPKAMAVNLFVFLDT